MLLILAFKDMVNYSCTNDYNSCFIYFVSVQRNASKLLYRIYSLYIVRTYVTDNEGEIIGAGLRKGDSEPNKSTEEDEQQSEKPDESTLDELTTEPKTGSPKESQSKVLPTEDFQWDQKCDQHLLVGIYKYGLLDHDILLKYKGEVACFRI